MKIKIGPFYRTKCKKSSYSESRVMRCTIFAPKMVQLPQTNFFLKKIINIIFVYLLALSIVQNLKKILTADPDLWGCLIFGPKIAHLPKWEFFSENLLISLAPFIQAYLPVKNKSQRFIYSRLKNTEISLAENHFWLELGFSPGMQFSQTFNEP